MKREIKFRIWDGESMRTLDNMYVGVGQIGFSDSHYVDLTEEDREQVQLMQFTGLLDKNGVEIYEGDIIRLYDGATHHIYEVLYSEPDTAFTLKAHGRWWDTDISTKLYLSEWENLDIRYKMSYYSLSAIQEEFEVIGNIYEHSHLLESNHDKL